MLNRSQPPNDGFLNRSTRMINGGVQLLGSVKGLYEAGKFAYSGLQAARPLLALL
jgi:hypothetical protein